MPKHDVPDTRENWQLGANRGGDSHEVKVFDVVLRVVAEAGDHILVKRHPKEEEFKRIYYEMDIREHPDDYRPTDAPGATWFDESTDQFMRNATDGTPRPDKRGGIVPDIMMVNTTTGKWVLIEVKRQNAAGNAHERMYKYVTLIPEFKRLSGVENPFMACVCGPICGDPKYRAEIRSSFECSGLGKCVHFVRDEASFEEWIRSSPLREITHSSEEGAATAAVPDL